MVIFRAFCDSWQVSAKTALGDSVLGTCPVEKNVHLQMGRMSQV